MKKTYSLNHIIDKADWIQEHNCPDVSTACEDLETEIINQSSAYIFDYIDEAADGSISIYTADLIEQCSTPEFVPYIDESIASFGFPKGENPVIRLYQQAQFLYYQRALFDNLKGISQNAIIDHLSGSKIVLDGDLSDIEEAFKDVSEYVNDYIDNFDVDYHDRLSDIIDDFDQSFNEKIEELAEEHNLSDVKITDNSDDEMIRCLFIPTGSTPREIKINKENSLKELQDIVGGYIEALPLQSKDDSQMIDLICNEEGKIENLPLNRYLRESVFSGNEKDSDVLDYIAGDCVLIAANDEGEWISVSDVNYSHYEETFREPDNVFLGSILLTDEFNFDPPAIKTETPEREESIDNRNDGDDR